jgi:hypothetical protein
VVRFYKCDNIRTALVDYRRERCTNILLGLFPSLQGTVTFYRRRRFCGIGFRRCAKYLNLCQLSLFGWKLVGSTFISFKIIKKSCSPGNGRREGVNRLARTTTPLPLLLLHRQFIINYLAKSFNTYRPSFVQNTTPGEKN